MELTLTAASGLLNGDAVSQILGNHTTDWGPHGNFFLFLYIQETTVRGFGSRTTSCLLPEKRGALRPVSSPVKSRTSATYWQNISHISISSYKGVWETGQKELGVDVG